MVQEVITRPGMLVTVSLVKQLSSSLRLIVILVKAVKQTVLIRYADPKTNRDLSVAQLFVLISPSRCGGQWLITTIMAMSLKQLIWCTQQQPSNLESQRWTFSNWGRDRPSEICLRRLVTPSRPASSTPSTTRPKRWANQVTTASVWDHSYKLCKFTVVWIENARKLIKGYKRKVN